MGRGRSRDQQALPLEKPVPRKLSPDEHDRVAHQLAVKGLAIRHLKRDLSTTTAERRKDIKRLEAERATLEDMLVSHEQLLPQKDLKFSPVEAVTAIAAVATVAGDTPPKEPATAAHTFVPDKKGEGTCWACGKPKDDAMHGAETQPTDCGDQPSKLEGLTNREAIGLVADVINEIAPGAGELLRNGAEEVLTKPPEDPPPPAEEPEGELLATIGPHPYKHVRQARGMCGVCGVKRRQHPSAAAAPAVVPTEPHAFFPTAAGADCRICGSGREDPVHTSAVAERDREPDAVLHDPAAAQGFDFDDGEPAPKVISSRPLRADTP